MAKKITKQTFSGNPEDIRVLDELEELLPALDAEAAKGLEESLIEEGQAYDSLWMWGDILVDGHNRYRLCRKNDIPFDTKQVFASAKDLEDVKYRMRKLAYGQRNMPKAVCGRYRAENVLYLVERKRMSKTDAVKAVAVEAEVTERQVYRDLERAEKIQAMASSVQHSAAISNLGNKEIGLFSLLDHEEQHAAVERAGHDPDKLSGELKRMSKVEGSKLFNVEEHRKQQERKAKREEAVKRNLFKLFQEQLGEAAKTMRAIKKAYKIKEGTFNRVYGFLTKADEGVATWKPEDDN